MTHAAGKLPVDRRPSALPLLQWGVALFGCVVIVAIFRGVVPQVSHLCPQELPGNPYFQPQHFFLLYMGMPAVVLASLGCMLLPGVALVVAWDHKETLGELVLKGFGASMLLHGGTFSVLKLFLQAEQHPGIFRIALLGTACLSWLVLLSRWWSGTSLPLLSGGDRRLFLWVLLIPLTALILLLPIIFWQDFNSDGLELLTLGRSLNVHVIPRLPSNVFPGLGLGMVTASLPVHWFLVLFGPIEASARLPLVLYLPVLFVGIVLLAECHSARKLSVVELAILALQISVFVVVMACNATYNPYSADIASPASIDILAIVLMVGTVYWFWSRNHLWLLVFSALCYLTRPTGLLFLLLLGTATGLLAPRKLRNRLGILAAAGAFCLVLGFVYERVLASYAGVGIEEGAGAITLRLRYLRLDDVSRLLFLLVPGGVLPALSLLAFKRQDVVGRSLALITAGYFLFFYVLAFVALHHFAPAMLLPITVFWRLLAQREQNWRVNSLAAAAALLALAASMPHRMEVDRSMRRIGEITSYKIGDYNGGYAELQQAYRERTILYELFPSSRNVKDPATEREGEPWVQIHYASQMSGGAREINYLVQSVTDPPPANFTKVASRHAAVLYVKDLERWQRDRDRPPPTDFRSSLYAIPKETLFRTWGLRTGNYGVDLYELLGRLRSLLGRKQEH